MFPFLSIFPHSTRSSLSFYTSGTRPYTPFLFLLFWAPRSRFFLRRAHRGKTRSRHEQNDPPIPKYPFHLSQYPGVVHAPKPPLMVVPCISNSNDAAGAINFSSPFPSNPLLYLGKTTAPSPPNKTPSTTPIQPTNPPTKACL